MTTFASAGPIVETLVDEVAAFVEPRRLVLLVETSTRVEFKSAASDLELDRVDGRIWRVAFYGGGPFVAEIDPAGRVRYAQTIGNVRSKTSRDFRRMVRRIAARQTAG